MEEEQRGSRECRTWGSSRELDMCCTAYVTQCTSSDGRYSPGVVDVVLAVHVPLIEPRRLDVEELQRLRGEARE